MLFIDEMSGGQREFLSAAERSSSLQFSRFFSSFLWGLRTILNRVSEKDQ